MRWRLKGDSGDSAVVLDGKRRVCIEHAVVEVVVSDVVNRRGMQVGHSQQQILEHSNAEAPLYIDLSLLFLPR